MSAPTPREPAATAGDNNSGGGADLAYARLRQEIVSGALRPNERLVEAELTERLGVGRAGVRTALARLEQDGLVVRERHRGAKVRLVGEQEALEILEARGALEGVAARHAALNAKPEEVALMRSLLEEMAARLTEGDLPAVSETNARLHRVLLDASGHKTVQRLTDTLNSQIVRFQFRTVLVPGRSARSLEEHTAIVEAIAAGDPDAAEAATRQHISNVAQALRDAAASRRGDAPALAP